MDPKYKCQADCLAQRHGGACLADVIKRVHDKIPWQCARGHTWEISLAAVKGTKNKKGSWCPKCAPNAPVPESEYQEYAQLHSGSLIKQARYVTSPTIWCCRIHGEFSRTFSNMKTTGTFCPICSTSLGEQRCKKAAEQLFKKEFKKVRLKEMRGLGGKPLELDLYNEELKLAIEHQGVQHYQEKKYFGVNRFARQSEHDQRKVDYCRSNGITLIQIKQFGEITSEKEFRLILKSACELNQISIPDDFDSMELDLAVQNLENPTQTMWKRVLEEAQKRSWQTITQKYLGVLVKHQFSCRLGHRIEKTPTSLFAGEGCPKCNLKPVLLEDGKVFESLSKAARHLGVPVTYVYRAVKQNGSTNGIKISSISHEQFELFSQDQAAARLFWEGEKHKYEFDHHSRIPVITSTGKLFQSGDAFAKSIQVDPTTVYSAIRRNGTIKGIQLFPISKEQEIGFAADPKSAELFLASKSQKKRYQKPNAKLIITESGYIFDSITDFAQYLKVNNSLIYSAMEKTLKCRNIRFKIIDPNIGLLLRSNSEARSKFLEQNFGDRMPAI